MSGGINFNQFGNNNIRNTNFDKNKNTSSNKEQIESSQEELLSQPTTKKFSAEEVQGFMNAQAVYAQAGIKQSNIENIDPAKYLSSETISDIEKSMMVFEKMYDEAYSAINNEFGDKISENAKKQLALLYFS